jgi:nicotinamide-nucleotide amidase
MNAEIISIGTELLRGEITDTNASWLASQLTSLGASLDWVTQVGDHQERLVATFHRAWKRADLTVATGGLGPTADDLTRESIAEMFGETLQVDPVIEADLRALFAQFGRDMPPHNLKQATRIPSAQVIPNPIGTAPGWWIEREGKIIVVMPGPPREMKLMWEEQVFPALMRRHTGDSIVCRTLKTLGLSEAGVDEMVSRSPLTSLVDIGIYAKADGVHIRLVAKDAHKDTAEGKIREVEDSLREIMGEHVWGVDEDTLVGIIGNLLVDSGQSLATMESYTGGLLAASFGGVADALHYYRGGFVVGKPGRDGDPTFFNLDSPFHTANRLDAACAMVTTVRQRLGADIGVGIAGPQGNLEEENAVAIAVGDGKDKRTRESNWPTSRRDVRQWIAVAALFELRLFLT